MHYDEILVRSYMIFAYKTSRRLARIARRQIKLANNFSSSVYFYEYNMVSSQILSN